jgi:hypothetical protein
MSAICTVCGLPADDPPHMPPPDEHGRCAVCVQMRQPGFLERIATNAMPACFTPTRTAFVRLAALAIEQRGGTRQ